MTTGTDTQDASPVTLAAARSEFDADVTYLDSAPFGQPPWSEMTQRRGVENETVTVVSNSPRSSSSDMASGSGSPASPTE